MMIALWLFISLLAILWGNALFGEAIRHAIQRRREAREIEISEITGNVFDPTKGLGSDVLGRRR